MTPYDRAQWFRTIGIAELPGKRNHPVIQAALMLCGFDAEEPDETAWCSAFVNVCHRLENYGCTNSARARSWLRIGAVIELADMQIGDVVILKRGDGRQPGPEVIAAPGHVGFFAGWTAAGGPLLLGGNQSNRITIAPLDLAKVLGVRRIDH